MEEEKLELRCPICEGTHIYRLKVDRTYIIKRFNFNVLREIPQPIKITRIFICPTKNEKFQASFTLPQTLSDQIKSVAVNGVIDDEEKQYETRESGVSKIEISSVGSLSPHNEALYETGKEMLKSSVDTARDFCKFMITVSTGSIPIYLGLLEFVLPENITLPMYKLILLVIPPFLFLISAIVFIFGYFPQVDYLSLDIVEEIKQAYEETVVKRKRWTNCGILLFLGGSVLAILSIIINIIG